MFSCAAIIQQIRDVSVQVPLVAYFELGGANSQPRVTTEHIAVPGGFIRRTTVESPERRAPPQQQHGFFERLFGWGGEENMEAERQRERELRREQERQQILEYQREMQRREEQRRLQQQQAMQDPLTQLFGAIFGGAEPQAQNRQVHPFLQFSIQRGGGRGQNQPTLIIIGDENEFLEHQNFMRNNREHVRDANFIEDMLNQLFVQGAAGNQPNTMNRNELTEIKTKKFKKSSDVHAGEEEKCPICVMDFENNEEIKELPCKHMFHPGCIDTWLVRNCTCPICKRDVKEMLHGRGQQSRPN